MFQGGGGRDIESISTLLEPIKIDKDAFYPRTRALLRDDLKYLFSLMSCVDNLG